METVVVIRQTGEEGIFQIWHNNTVIPGGDSRKQVSGGESEMKEDRH